MPAEPARFHFSAASPTGELLSGELEAGSIEQASLTLRARGFQPLRIDTRPAAANWLHRDIDLGARRLSTAEAAGFCRELSLLLGSGLPLVQALGVMTTALPVRNRLGRFTTSVRHGLQLGKSLSTAMATAGYRLPLDLVPVSSAGETSGTLVAALDMLAASYGESDRLRRAIVAASAYPALLLAVAIVVLGFLGVIVAPTLVALFVSMDRPVPMALGILDGAGRLLTGHGIAASAGLLALGLVVATVMRDPLMHLCARLPLLGPALRWAAVRRFVGTLRLQLAGRVRLGDALDAAFAAAGFAGAASRTAAAMSRIRAGAPLARELRDLRLFPHKVVQLIEIGETSARLPEVLGLLQHEAQAQFERRMTLLTSVLAPVLILIVGSLIAGVVVSVFSALLEINEVGFR